MICSICKKGDTSVVDSRPTEDGTAIRRRRLCICGARFTTFERVQFREIMVIKKNGRKSSFDRDKLSKSIYIALKKRPIDTETAEKFISKISRALEELGQSEISTNTIGTMVMEGLKELDPVAYVRFASVYRNFREEKDFIHFVDKIDVLKKSIYRLIEIGANGTRTTLTLSNQLTNISLATDFFKFDASSYPNYYINN
mgnify:CR=1 FL=1